MEGLGKYTLSPTLDGKVYVYHDKKSLRKTHENEVDALHALQVNDWQEMRFAFADVLASINSLQLHGYYINNAGRAFELSRVFTGYFETLQKDDPITQGIHLKLLFENLPRFACTKNVKENTRITGRCAVIRDYYDRYLAKYETYNNSFLTA